VLTAAELHELDSTLLPALERHHLRLLAHSLRCLQQAAEAGEALPLWLERQPELEADPSFIPVLREQLGKAALQLEQIAQQQCKPLLQLELADLVGWARACADARLATAPLTSPHN
jgi:hypothetical protein